MKMLPTEPLTPLALIVRAAEEDLTGSTVSGRGLRALLRAVGLDLGGTAPVVWRNMRDEVGGCWRKHDVSGSGRIILAARVPLC